MGRLVINGEEIYELDEQCLREKYKERMKEQAGKAQLQGGEKTEKRQRKNMR